jgi:hypothetical protein
MAKQRTAKKVDRALAPMADVAPASKAAIAKWTPHAPGIAELWRQWGWGRFGDGFVWLVDPAKLEELVDRWLGGPSPHRVPLGRTALGDLLYYRDLRDRARALGMRGKQLAEACDVSIVDVRYKRVVVIATSLAEFARQLDDTRWLREVLRKDLFDAALPRLGAPARDQIYGFVPALGLGGAEDPAALERVQADVHLEILLQL